MGLLIITRSSNLWKMGSNQGGMVMGTGTGTAMAMAMTMAMTMTMAMGNN